MDTTTGHAPATLGSASSAASEPLRFSVKVYRAPWSPSTMSEEQFGELLVRCGRETAERLVGRLGRDGYPRTSFAVALMDPTVGPDMSNDEALMAVFAFGDEGKDYIPNALAKAYVGRTLAANGNGPNVGEAVHGGASYLIPDGGFRYGHNTNDCGASGLSETNDLREAAWLRDAVYGAVNEAREAWEERTGPGRWFTKDNQPGDAYVLPSRTYLLFELTA